MNTFEIYINDKNGRYSEVFTKVVGVDDDIAVAIVACFDFSDFRKLCDILVECSALPYNDELKPNEYLSGIAIDENGNESDIDGIIEL
jgi:hypothetical protein